MTDRTPNPADFSVNENAGKFIVDVAYEGSTSIELQAASADIATTLVQNQIDQEDLDPYPVHLDSAEITSVRPYPAMYRVMRDGRAMQVSCLKAGDTPRDPDERGF